MPTLLAVSLSNESVAFASVRCEREGRPHLEEYLEVKRSDFAPLAEDSAVAENSTPGSINIPEKVKSFISQDKFTDVVCLFEPPRFFSELLTFPFDNPSKVEQVAPLELEEALPFEIENYTIEPILLERSKLDAFSAEREFLVLGVESEFIKSELEFLKQLELDPVLFVPKIAVLASLAQFLPEESTLGGAAFVTIEHNKLLFALTRDGQPLLQRDIAAASEDKALQEVLPTLLSASRILAPSRLFFVGIPFGLNLKGIESKQLSIADLEFGDDLHLPPSLSTVGMLALTATRVNKLDTANFRKGAFRYRGNLKSYLEPFIEDKSYVLTLLGAIIAWVGIVVYSSASEMAALDSKAHELIVSAFPNESVPSGSELSFVEGKLDNLESTMKGLGNISSLSPLEALTELSEVVPSGIDVAIDSLSTTQVGVQFGGSVGGMGSVGKLIGALEKRDKFCEVKVDPRGSLPGGERVRIVGELKYCP
jgi:hypothetical protein